MWLNNYYYFDKWKLISIWFKRVLGISSKILNDIESHDRYIECHLFFSFMWNSTVYDLSLVSIWSLAITGITGKLFSDHSDHMETKFLFCQQSSTIPATANDHNDHDCRDRFRVYSLVSIWSLTIVMITRIVVITENIRSLWLSKLLKIDFHIIAGIVKIAGYLPSLRSSRSLRSLCCDFHMIDRIIMIITITAITALVVSVNLLRSLTIIHNRYDRRDRLWFYPNDHDRCNCWQSLGSLAVAGIVGDHWQM